MDDLSLYDRSAHPASCPCKLCVTFDVALAVQDGVVDTRNWKLGGLEGWITWARSCSLNWDLPPTHCILCGGNIMKAWITSEHYEVKRYNTQALNGKFYTSWMISKHGGIIASYKSLLLRRRKELIPWVAANLNLCSDHCTGIAAKEHEEWIEIRLAFTQLVEEDYARRVERKNEEYSRAREAARRTGGAVQGITTVAWQSIQLHATGT